MAGRHAITLALNASKERESIASSLNSSAAAPSKVPWQPIVYLKAPYIQCTTSETSRAIPVQACCFYPVCLAQICCFYLVCFTVVTVSVPSHPKHCSHEN